MLVIDAQNGIEKQDLRLAKKVLAEGRVLILAINKIDLLENANEVSTSINERLEYSLPQAKGIIVINISALTGFGVKKLLPEILKAYNLWNKRISTAHLNRWLEKAILKHPPPSFRGSKIKLKYMTQSSSRPPTFIIFSSKAEQIPESYIRYLSNTLRKNFNIPGIPIRIYIRKSKNPFSF